MAELLKIESKPIPAFYCCYLLRSKNRKSYYIGSTPNPARRLGQHNGTSKGGAKRTAMQGKRPWEMTCIVTGFPSHFAALQFEWAWQNTHMTRHIDRDVRDARAVELQKGKKAASAATGRRKKPPMSLEARLKNLHHLLGVDSFRSWPLHLRFFAPDIFKQWERHTAKMPQKLRESITVQVTPAEMPKLAPEIWAEVSSHYIPDIIRSIPVAYEDCKPYVEKSIRSLQDKTRHSCGVCKKSADSTSGMVIVCPTETCETVSHLACLSKRFLIEDDSSTGALIPMEGSCPGCRTNLQWSTLMKELSLRTYGDEEIAAMFKPKRRKKTDTQEIDEEPAEEDEDLDETWMKDVDGSDAEIPESPSR
ncbi:structure-specific endonuclease subunit SLX1 [Boeremia exigua]|uniref:structure-specific endonuclease subunit SLX1 n=1 Tax=Boeremia exigua TaxID=749465 RepID=UPI001E8D4B81|nr:structure-specific endonuclease subunit SLX1 [Boeremia exigua]KAH6638966.1 structure-specific endonuclease subunit SLX1 [Boeremia exigua]